MIMNTHFSSVVFAIIVTFNAVTTAYPMGSGSCVAGPAVLGSDISPHLESDYGGKLLDGGYKAFINETYFYLEAMGDSYFKGFMLRLSAKDGESAAGLMSILPEYEDIAQEMKSTGEGSGIPATCAIDVAGVTHKHSYEKTAVGVYLDLSEGVTYKMAITVVKDEHDWYYTNKTITVQAAKSKPSPSPKKTVLVQTPSPTVTYSPTMADTISSTTGATSTAANEDDLLNDDAPTSSPSPSPTSNVGRSGSTNAATSSATSVEGLSALVLTYSMLCFTFLFFQLY